MKRLVVLLSSVLLLLVVGCSKPAITSDNSAESEYSKDVTITIGTGSQTGVYYPSGGQISKLLNAESMYNIRSVVQSTAGSEYNINTVLVGDLNFGIAQADLVYEAGSGTGRWDGKGAQGDLRQVFGLYDELVSFLVTDKSGINELSDIKGMKFSTGPVGSGTASSAEIIFSYEGFSDADFRLVSSQIGELPGLLQDGGIDGFVYVVGHPNGAFKEATIGKIKTRFIGVSDETYTKINADFPYYIRGNIPVSEYSAVNTEAVKTLGIQSVLVASAKESDAIVYALTKTIFEKLEEFKSFHPAYTTVTAESMLSGFVVPVHPGALKYFEEAGLADLIPAKFK